MIQYFSLNEMKKYNNNANIIVKLEILDLVCRFVSLGKQYIKII